MAWGLILCICALMLVTRNSLITIDELAKSSVRLIQSCLDSDNHLMKLIVNYGVHFGRMSLPVAW